MGHIPMIITASGAADNECEDVAVAARIRARGDRPGMPALRAAVEAARASVAGLVTGPLPDPATAAVQAIAALGARSGAVPVQHDGA
jgi:hypothetical protein